MCHWEHKTNGHNEYSDYELLFEDYTKNLPVGIVPTDTVRHVNWHDYHLI